jgi:hypothetical protein
VAEIKEVFHEHKGRYDAPRIRRALRRRGARPSRKRVARLMRAHGLCGHTPHRFRKTTDSRHMKRIAPNLLERAFKCTSAEPGARRRHHVHLDERSMVVLGSPSGLYSRRVVG